MRERRGAHRVLVGKPEVRRPLGKPRRRWEGNIKIDLRVVGPVGGGHGPDQSGYESHVGAFVNTVMNIRVP